MRVKPRENTTKRIIKSIPDENIKIIFTTRTREEKLARDGADCGDRTAVMRNRMKKIALEIPEMEMAIEATRHNKLQRFDRKESRNLT